MEKFLSSPEGLATNKPNYDKRFGLNQSNSKKIKNNLTDCLMRFLFFSRATFFRRCLQRAVLVVFLFCLGFVGCLDEDGYLTYKIKQDVKNFVVYPVEIPFITASKGDNWLGNTKFPKDTNLVIKTSAEWYNAFGSTSSTDYSIYQIIAVFDTIRPTTGYRIEIANIMEYADKIVVRYTTFWGVGFGQMICQPYNIVRIPRTSKEIVFEHYSFEYPPNPFVGTWYLVGSVDTLPKVIFTEDRVTGILPENQEWYDNAIYDYDYAGFDDKIRFSHYPHHPEIKIINNMFGYRTTYSFKKSMDTLLIKNFWSLNPGAVYPSELTDILLYRSK